MPSASASACLSSSVGAGAVKRSKQLADRLDLPLAIIFQRRVGKDVTNVKVGDEVVMHCGQWNRNCEWVKSGGDPMYSPSFRIWGYETNFGSFAQFTKVQGHQCMPKPKHMTWEESAAYTLVAATAWRMLHGWGANSIKKGDVALIWGGAGGLGSWRYRSPRRSARLRSPSSPARTSSTTA